MAGGKRGARTGLVPSIFDVRPDDKPAWPTFRGQTLTEEMIGRLRDCPEIDWVFFSQGKHIEHELPNGGLSRGGEAFEYNMVSFEARLFVQRTDTRKRTPLYLIGWIGGYGKGCIMHMSWQYPHVCERDAYDLETRSLAFYAIVAREIYYGRDWDREVMKMVSQQGSR